MNRLFIIKIGGNVLDKPESLNRFLDDFASIKEPKILIHGGGKIATKIGEQLGIESNYVNGRRVTDSATLGLVTMVYGGLVNKQLVAQLQYQKEQSQLELNKTIRQREDARFALQQQELAVGQAAEALRILQNRYQQGLVTTNDILQSQTLLSQQKLNQAQAVFQFNTTQAYLQFLTSTSEK